MAVKEASQREIIDQQFIHIADLQKVNNKFKEERLDPVSFFNSRASGHLCVLQEPSPPSPSEMSKRMEMSVNRMREEHADELLSLINGHAQALDAFESQHASTMKELNAALATSKSDMSVALESQQGSHDRVMVDVKRSHAEAIAALRKEHDLVAEELEKSLSIGDEQRRQLKMKADQALFQLSKVRDEHQLQRNNDSRQMADLSKASAQLEKLKSELEVANANLVRQVGDLEQKVSRSMAALPPQGPPPNTPLPPTPSMTGTSLEASPWAKMSSSGSSSGHSAYGPSSTSVSGADIVAAVAQLPEPVGQIVHKVLAERDSAITERETLKQQLEAGKGLSQEAVSAKTTSCRM